MILHSQIRRRNQLGEHGYIMLTLLLMMALLIIAAAVIVPSITFEIRRDQEEEMIHRGVQYSRAIKAYYKKFNRYPMKIEDLENTNRQRFLRKRYKDPITKQDFKLLHFGEVQLALTGGMGGGTIPGASTIGPNGSLTPGSGLNGTPGIGGNSAFGGNSNSAFGQNQQAPQPGTDPSQPGSPDASGGNSTGPGNGTTSSGDKLGTATFGGAPIVGVASTSKKDTIREYDHKKKYDQWKFIYDPTMDTGRLITTPYQPQVAGFGMQGSPNLNGQNGNSSQPSNGFGNSNGFGSSSSGFGNSPTTPSNGGFGQQNPPSNPPPQQ